MKRALFFTILFAALAAPGALAAPAQIEFCSFDAGTDGAVIHGGAGESVSDLKHDGTGSLKLYVNFDRDNREGMNIRMDRPLPGRPKKVTFWFYSDGRQWELMARVYDRGTNGTRNNIEGWDTNRVLTEGEGWQQIVLEMPGDGQGLMNAGGTQGTVDYPLVLQEIRVYESRDREVHSKPLETEVAIDTVMVETDADPEEAISLNATAAPEKTRYPVNFKGGYIYNNRMSYQNVNYSYRCTAAPGMDEQLAWRVTAQNSFSEDNCTFDVNYVIKDYDGAEVDKGKFSLDVAPQTTATHTIAANPQLQLRGPYYLILDWTETNHDVKGQYQDRQGRGNARRRINLFETVHWPEDDPHFAVLPEARRSERRGLRATLLPQELDRGQTGPPAAEIPLNHVLDGRPAKLGVWVRLSGHPVQLYAKFVDSKQNVQQRDVWNNWNLGPIDLQPAGQPKWQFVEIPVPEFGRPKARADAPDHQETDSLLNYPLTLSSLKFVADTQTTVDVDDLSLDFHPDEQMQTNNDLVSVMSVSDKVSQVLYSDDQLDVVLTNTDLTAEKDLGYDFALESFTGRIIARQQGTQHLKAGTDAIISLKLQNAPLGAYRLKLEVKENGRIVFENTSGKRANWPDPADVFTVYEPQNQPMEPSQLAGFLRNRNSVIKDLGINRDIVLCAWHSVDGSPAVEPFPGYFKFDFLEQPVAERMAAGVEPVGRLGFTALWADPGVTYSLTWYGSTYVYPSKTIYWEEYVRRTVAEMGDRIKTWVVWDQPDSGALGGEPIDFLEKLLEPAAKQIRKVQPNAEIISGAISRHNIESYVQGMAEIGAHKLIDKIGLLPTTAPLSPEDGYLDVLLRRAQRIRQEERVSAPFAVLNLSYITGPDGRDRVSEFEQAVYVPRAYVICRSVGIDDFWLEAGAPIGKMSTRNSSELVFWNDGIIQYKPAALSCKFFLDFFRPAEFIGEVALNDRFYHKARAYLFRKGQDLLLVAWRQDGTSMLHLPAGAKQFYDYVGNATAASSTVTLSRAPVVVTYPNADAAHLTRALERALVEYDDEPQSAWKRNWVHTLDVGDPTDEQKYGYKVEGGKKVGPVESYYHNEYGQFVSDSGYHYTGSESFTVDVTPIGKADMIVRKRINYSVPDQMVVVYCDGKFVGNWMSFKRDRRNVWRDQEYIIPHKFFENKKSVELKFEAKSQDGATSYRYQLGPLNTNVLYVSDMSYLVGSSGYGPMVNRDTNILGGTIAFHKPEAEAKKGIGTNAADQVAQSLVVLSLNKQYKRFKATVGVDAATNGRGSVRFRVGIGSKSLFDSGTMTFYSPAKEVDVDVSDAVILMLMVTDTGDGRRDDVANWADARLELK